jgi:hypothetical protein
MLEKVMVQEETKSTRSSIRAVCADDTGGRWFPSTAGTAEEGKTS